MLVFEIVYILTSIWLALYSINSLYLLWLYHRTKGPRPAPCPPGQWPKVTVQLPVYNEKYTVDRLLAAVCKLDYPPHLLEIQVLDDSSDETSALLSARVKEFRAEGANIVLLHREKRQGFKAGALAYGLHRAEGDFLAIFDADFVPPADFLQRTIPWFNDPKVGCIQARWTHLNRDDSLLTRLQAIAIDAHFMVEQTARSRNGLFLNFNGSAGVWRRTCIQESGGWMPRTLTEDFDLSYRAQLCGWRIDYLPDLAVPAELPAQMAAYKLQQARWARGSIQTARQLLKPLLHSGFPLRVKAEGLLHLTHYLVHPLILLILFLSLSIQLSQPAGFFWVPFLLLSMMMPPLLYLGFAAPEAPPWWGRLGLIPGLFLLSVGISFNNARAALTGLFSPEHGVFNRTPKFGLHKPGDTWQGSRYALRIDPWVWAEVFLACFALTGLIPLGKPAPGHFNPWFLVYAAGYGYVAWVTLLQAARQGLTTYHQQ